MKQKDVAEAVGERPDTFSKILAGTASYNLSAPMIINVLNVIGKDFIEYGAEVAAESAKIQAAGRS